MTINSDLLHRIADAIEANPERYEQAVYITHFVAGWAMELEMPGELEKWYEGRRFNANDDPWVIGAKLLGIEVLGEDARCLFGGGSQPLLGHTVPEALHKMAEMGEIDPTIWGLK